MNARARFLAAKGAGEIRLAAAALAEVVPSEIDDECMLEILVLADTTDPRARGVLEKLIGGVVVARSAHVPDDLFWMALDRWRASSDFGPQRACDAMAAVLARAPGELRALEAYLEGSLREEPYLHRGLDIESIAARASPCDAATLLAAQAYIRSAADGSPDRARLLLARARSLDPAVDLEAVHAMCLRAMYLPVGMSAEELDEALPRIDLA